MWDRLCHAFDCLATFLGVVMILFVGAIAFVLLLVFGLAETIVRLPIEMVKAFMRKGEK